MFSIASSGLAPSRKARSQLRRGDPLTRGDNLSKALAGGQEDKELAKVGEKAQIEEEQQQEVQKGSRIQSKTCMVY